MPIPALSAQVPTASAVTTGQDRVHQQRAAPQEWKHMWCPPGFYLSEFSGDCAPCTRGMDFTSHSNNLSSCQVCSSCRPDEEEISSCTPTKDSECRCKSGTFLEENSPELCQRCSTRCPDGMVEAEPCTSWSDLQCVKQESGRSQPVLGIVLGTVCALVVLLLSAYACAYCHRRRIRQGEVGGMMGRRCHSLLPPSLPAVSQTERPFPPYLKSLLFSGLALLSFPVTTLHLPPHLHLFRVGIISRPVSGLTVTSSPWPRLGGQDPFFRAPSRAERCQLDDKSQEERVRCVYTALVRAEPNRDLIHVNFTSFPFSPPPESVPDLNCPFPVTRLRGLFVQCLSPQPTPCPQRCPYGGRCC
uniref:TNFR-Cys domain-containing protein n=1 Tax=Rhinolophus ferrumequinum TaxID=59479 RepID=A0A671EIT7_RHIFE